MTANAIDTYLATLPAAQRADLERLRDRLRALLPDAVEVMSYNMPAFKIGTKAIAGYAGFKAHMSFFPHSSTVISAIAPRLDEAGFAYSKGGVRFTADHPLPDDILREIVQIRLAECGLEQRVA